MTIDKHIIKFILISCLSFANILGIHSQREGGVCIADSNITPHRSAMLHVISTDKGMLLPHVTILERDGIQPLTDGLTVYVTNDSPHLQYWDHHKAQWIKIEMYDPEGKNMIAPLGGVIMYYGNLEDFDENGTGKIGSPMEGWQICNGKKGSPDLKRRFIVGGNKLGTVPYKYYEIARQRCQNEWSDTFR